MQIELEREYVALRTQTASIELSRTRDNHYHLCMEVAQGKVYYPCFPGAGIVAQEVNLETKYNLNLPELYRRAMANSI